MSVGTKSRTVKLTEGESQWAIVVRMFRKRRTAVWGLRGTFVLVLVAVYAPLLSSGVPLLWREPGGSLELPWMRRLFDANYWTNGIDRFYNLIMVLMTLYFVASFVLRLSVASVSRRAARRRDVRGVLLVSGLLLMLLQVFGTSDLRLPWPWPPSQGAPHALLELLRQVVNLGAWLLVAWGLANGLGRWTHASPAARRGFAVRWMRRLVTFALVLVGLQALGFGQLKTSEPYVDYRAKAREYAAAGADHEAVFTLIPYGHREQLERSEDRYRGLLSFEDGETHLLGTDNVGRDVFARLLYGTRISLSVGLVAVAIYVTIGTILGAIAGYAGGRVDMLIMRCIEIIICVPGLFLILTIIALFGVRSIFMVMLAIGIVGWTGIARLVRGEILRERAKDYVSAAKSLGLGSARILFRHILPNAIAPVIVSATFGVAGAIITESTLSFLGLGDVSVPSWGMILNAGRQDQEWHMILCPGVAIFITVTLLNLVGDGLRDALDPKLRN